jgi:hypothetical protein
MKAQHTPAPWIIRGKDIVNADNSFTVAIAHGPAGRCIDVEAEHKANAHLIAAAPCLLVVLQNLVRVLEPLEQRGALQVPGLTLNGARYAIAIATGQQ